MCAKQSPLGKLNHKLGELVIWLILIMVLLQFTIVVLRYVFSFGSIKLQELLLYLHASLFMLAIAYTWARQRHVRLDIFYSRWSPKTQAWVDLVGTVFFVLPLCACVGWFCWRYVAAAWRVQESSTEFSGLAYLYLLKSLLLVFAALLAIQALSFIIVYMKQITDARRNP